MADFLRATCIGLALPLGFLCIYSMWRERMGGPQRLRFLGLAVISFVVASGQIDAWGAPISWRIPLLVVGLLFALGGTLASLWRRTED